MLEVGKAYIRCGNKVVIDKITAKMVMYSIHYDSGIISKGYKLSIANAEKEFKDVCKET